MTSVFDDKLDQLFQVPRTWEAELPWCSGAKPVWVESVPYRGKTTRFFACYGLPEGATPERPAPGVGGTFFIGVTRTHWCVSRSTVHLVYVAICGHYM